MRCDYYDCGCSLDGCDDDEIHIVTICGREYHLCDDCYEAHEDDELDVCPDCGGIVAAPDMFRAEGMSEAVCQDCFNDHYYRCARCGDYCHSDDIYYCEECEEDFCRDCYEYHQNEQHRNNCVGHYHSHRYVVPESDAPYLGVELEMGNADEDDMITASNVINDEFSDYFNMEDDGSIRDYGFETISKPFTWRWWYNHRDMVCELYSVYHEYGMEPHRSCGFHVHITKKFLPALTWRALQWFISSNQHLFEYIAGREENEWVSYNHDGVEDGDKIHFYDSQDSTHYAALSLQTSKYVTAEYRIFCPVDNDYDFFRHIAIVQGLYEWAKSSPLFVLHMAEMPRRAVYDWFNWNKQQMEATDDKCQKFLYNLVNEQLVDAMKEYGY